MKIILLSAIFTAVAVGGGYIIGEYLIWWIKKQL